MVSGSVPEIQAVETCAFKLAEDTGVQAHATAWAIAVPAWGGRWKVSGLSCSPAPEAAVATVRSGRAASIFPMVYHDLVQWAGAHGFQTSGPGREIWVNEVDDIAEVDQQVFEVQLPFTRPEPPPA